jgi:hypothetical protein
MKFEKTCKMCKIGFANPKLLDKLHKQRFKDKKSLRLFEEEINNIIKTSDDPKIQSLEKISYVAVQNHFAKHMGKVLTAKYKTDNIMNVTQNARKELDQQNLMPIEVRVGIRKLEKDRINLTNDLSNLYETLKERFEQFDEEQGKRIDLGLPGEKGNLEGYSVLSKELRACLGELSKIKQAERLTKNIIQFALKHYTKVVIEESIKELETMKRMLIPYVKDPDKIDRLVNTIQQNIGLSIAKSASDTLLKTSNQFNIE